MFSIGLTKLLINKEVFSFLEVIRKPKIFAKSITVLFIFISIVIELSSTSQKILSQFFPGLQYDGFFSNLRNIWTDMFPCNSNLLASSLRTCRSFHKFYFIFVKSRIFWQIFQFDSSKNIGRHASSRFIPSSRAAITVLYYKVPSVNDFSVLRKALRNYEPSICDISCFNLIPAVKPWCW